MIRFPDSASLSPETRSVIDEFKAEIIFHSIKLDYDYLTAHEVLAQLLPDGMDIPSSFETVGHIAHVNLRDEHDPFKSIIGQVLLEVSRVFYLHQVLLPC